VGELGTGSRRVHERSAVRAEPEREGRTGAAAEDRHLDAGPTSKRSRSFHSAGCRFQASPTMFGFDFGLVGAVQIAPRLIATAAAAVAWRRTPPRPRAVVGPAPELGPFAGDARATLRILATEEIAIELGVAYRTSLRPGPGSFVATVGASWAPRVWGGP